MRSKIFKKMWALLHNGFGSKSECLTKAWELHRADMSFVQLYGDMNEKHLQAYKNTDWDDDTKQRCFALSEGAWSYLRDKEEGVELLIMGEFISLLDE